MRQGRKNLKFKKIANRGQNPHRTEWLIRDWIFNKHRVKLARASLPSRIDLSALKCAENDETNA